MKITLADTLELSVQERIHLVTEIWESIAECPEQIELTDATRHLLQKRLAVYRANPDAGSPWEEVKQRILNTPLIGVLFLGFDLCRDDLLPNGKKGRIGARSF